MIWPMFMSTVMSRVVFGGLEDWFKHNIKIVFHTSQRTEFLEGVAFMIKEEKSF